MRSVLTVLLIASPWLLAKPAATGLLERAIAREVARGTVLSSEAAPAARTAGGVVLRWDELGPVVLGHRVRVVLADGSRVAGRALVVREDALVVDIGRSRTVPATGPAAPIPRSSVTRIEVERRAGSWGRSLGTVLGALAGVVVGGYVAGQTADSAGTGIPLFLGIASGVTVAGYYGGRELDKEVTVITVAPSYSASDPAERRFAFR